MVEHLTNGHPDGQDQTQPEEGQDSTRKEYIPEAQRRSRQARDNREQQGDQNQQQAEAPIFNLQRLTELVRRQRMRTLLWVGGGVVGLSAFIGLCNSLYSDQTADLTRVEKRLAKLETNNKDTDEELENLKEENREQDNKISRLEDTPRPSRERTVVGEPDQLDQDRFLTDDEVRDLVEFTNKQVNPLPGIIIFCTNDITDTFEASRSFTGRFRCNMPDGVTLASAGSFDGVWGRRSEDIRYTYHDETFQRDCPATTSPTTGQETTICNPPGSGFSSLPVNQYRP